MKTSRRQFLSQAACGSCLMVAGSSMLFLDSCASSSSIVYESTEFSVLKSSFADQPNLIVKHKDAGRILIRKVEDDKYQAISLVCTHQNGKVSPDGKNLKCSRHGSTFDMDGKVVSGKAQEDLPVYHAKVEGENIIVKVS